MNSLTWKKFCFLNITWTTQWILEKCGSSVHGFPHRWKSTADFWIPQNLRVFPLYQWGMGSRPPHGYKNPCMLITYIQWWTMPTVCPLHCRIPRCRWVTLLVVSKDVNPRYQQFQYIYKNKCRHKWIQAVQTNVVVQRSTVI